jgi:RimJ/RimL family protein N-acetyltransferase
VEIHCDPENISSAGIPRKLDYTLEATLRERIKLDEYRWSDSMVWTLLASDYSQSPSAHAVIEAFDARGQKIL